MISNIDTNFYILIALVCIVILSYIIMNIRMNKISDKVSKLQKHVLYQQTIIEKYSNNSVTQDNIGKDLENTMLENEIKNEMKEEINPTSQSSTTVVQTSPQQEQTTQQEQSPPPNPINTILPLISSVMTMVNSSSGSEVNTTPSTYENEIQDYSQEYPQTATIEEIKDLKLEEEKMKKDIQQELNQLQISENTLESH